MQKLYVAFSEMLLSKSCLQVLTAVLSFVIVISRFIEHYSKAEHLPAYLRVLCQVRKVVEYVNFVPVATKLH